MSEAAKQSDPEKERKVAKLGPREVEIPESWDAVPFENAIELNPSYDKSGNGPFDFLPMDAVDEEKQTVEYWNTRQKEDCTNTWFKNGDTVYPKITPCTENGKIAFIRGIETGLGSGSTEFLVFHPREGITDPQFVYYLSNLPDFRSVTISLMEGSTGRQRVPSDVFKEGIQIPLPPLKEQRRIVDILSTVDKQIQQTDEMITKAAELKRGLRQDIVTGGIGHSSYREALLGPRRVKIPESWDVQLMGDVADIVSGGTPKKSTKKYWGGDIVWVTPTDVTAIEGMYISDSAEKITEQGLSDSSAHLLEPGAVLMTSRATIGEAVINTVPATTNQGFKSLVPGERLHNEYLYHYVHTIADYLTEIGGGSTFPEINKTDTQNIRVPIPPLDEQKRIAEILNRADKKRLVERDRKQKFQELKRGLIQDLLTGKVRVNAN